MKKKGKYVLIFGAVVVTLLMVSSACAVNVVQSESIKNNDGKNEVYVDPNIKLTRKNIPILKKSISQIDNPNISDFINRLINNLEKDGEINSEGIEKLIKTSSTGIFIKGIHFGLLGVDGPGGAICPSSFVLFFIKAIITSGIIAFAKGGFSTWFVNKNGIDSDYAYIETDIHNIVNDYTYESNHIGIAIGFIGVCMTGWGGHNLQTLHNRALLMGWAPLIIII